MNALDALQARTQPGYESAVQVAVNGIRAMVGADCGEGLESGQVAQAIAARLEALPVRLDHSPSAVVLRDLSLLEWCCGLAVEDQVKARISRLLRRDYRLQFEAAGLKRPKPDVAARRSHVVFIGSLSTPLHSPSVGAVAYLRTLTAYPKNQRIKVFHHGPIDPELAVLIREQLPATIKFQQIEQEPNFLALAAGQSPCTYHFWCYPRVNVDYSFLAMFGPTVMFTCADDAPVQYADAYFSSRPSEHIGSVWVAAPQGFSANHVFSKGADFTMTPTQIVRSKADLGFNEGDLVMATVGNRLAVDLDEAFVSGVELVMRERPNLRWLIVGALSEGMQIAMRSVLGSRFRHVPYDEDLGGLMQAVDVYINPFRRGGGNSAIIAARAGAAVLTRGDIGDVGATVPLEHGVQGADAYFAMLDTLLDDAGHRAAWVQAQRAHLDRWLDKDLYASEIDRIVGLAFERFRASAGRRLDTLFPDVGLAAAA